MKPKKPSIDTGPERLAAILQAHLEQLSPADRTEKLHAFHQVVAKFAAGVRRSRTSRLAAHTPPR
jgi:hypothetical protein